MEPGPAGGLVRPLLLLPCLAAATLTAAACSCRSHPCAQCGQPGATKRCTKCGLAHYCSRDCQATHWAAAHKFPCKQRGGRDGYLEALEVGFTKLRSWQSGLIGGRNQVRAEPRRQTECIPARLTPNRAARRTR